MKEIEKFRKTNLARIAYSLIYSGVLYYFDLDFLMPVGIAHLAFSALWMAGIESEVIVEERLWWSSFIPATLDSLYLTLLIYITGGLFSFVITGYVIIITLGSMTKDKNYGLYTVFVCALSFTIMGLCTVIGLLPTVNVFDANQQTPPMIAWLFAAPTTAVSLLLVNRIVSGIFIQLNGELAERQRNQERLERDLTMARRVQESILPGEGGFPTRSEMSFGSTYLSLESVGGDLYDVYDIGENMYGFLMADVSGHGVPAALVTTMAKVSFGSRTAYGLSPDHIVRMVNNDIYPLIGDLSYFLTAVYGIINLEDSTLEITRAGHAPPLLLRNDNSILELDTVRTMYIGVLEDLLLDTVKVKLEDGDRLILFTDGMTEGVNRSGEMYGDERFKQSIRRHRDQPVKEFGRALIQDLDRYCAGLPAEDDRALLCVDFHIKD